MLARCKQLMGTACDWSQNVRLFTFIFFYYFSWYICVYICIVIYYLCIRINASVGQLFVGLVQKYIKCVRKFSMLNYLKCNIFLCIMSSDLLIQFNRLTCVVLFDFMKFFQHRSFFLKQSEMFVVGYFLNTFVHTENNKTHTNESLIKFDGNNLFPSYYLKFICFNSIIYVFANYVPMIKAK